MATIIRNAKSGKDWTANELLSYNIKIVEQSYAPFFETAELPAVSQDIRSFVETSNRYAAIQANDVETYKLLHHLDLVQNPEVGEESAVDTFASMLLSKLGYASGFRIILLQQSLPLLMCGSNCNAQTCLCICDNNDIIILLAQEDTKRLDNGNDDPESQLIAEAIAAFQRNNHIRERDLLLPILEEMIFPAITLVGTSPVFYKIKVTVALNGAVIAGMYPAVETIVFRHIPRLPRRNGEGMKSLENRDMLIRYLQAFRRFV
jgi:hypothetical protein